MSLRQCLILLIFTTFAFLFLFTLSTTGFSPFPPTSPPPSPPSQESQATPSPTSPPTPAPVTILSTGDMMIGRSINYTAFTKKDFTWTYQEISPFLQSFTYAVANLETPIIANCPTVKDGMVFCAASQSAALLPSSGLDLFTLANNHTLNYGRAGLQETQALLQQNGLASIAQGELLVANLENQRFGFLAFDDTMAPLDLVDYQATIASAAATVDHLFVALHFGAEYRYEPLARQTELAHLAIDSGARIILGNHAHWYEPLEFYRSGVIIYAHGNFVFDQMWSEPTREGVLAAWHFTEGALSQITIYPVYITEHGKANLLKASQPGAIKILTHFQKISSPASTLVDDRLIFPYPP